MKEKIIIHNTIKDFYGYLVYLDKCIKELKESNEWSRWNIQTGKNDGYYIEGLIKKSCITIFVHGKYVNGKYVD